MNCQYPEVPEKVEVFQWMRRDPETGSDTAHCVGVKARDISGLLIEDSLETPEVNFDGAVVMPVYLMKHSHTGELEWVEESRLKPYPLDGKPIEEPTK